MVTAHPNNQLGHLLLLTTNKSGRKSTTIGPLFGIRRQIPWTDRKSTRLNSSHGYISYAVFCLKKKKTHHIPTSHRLIQVMKKLVDRDYAANINLRILNQE